MKLRESIEERKLELWDEDSLMRVFGDIIVRPGPLTSTDLADISLISEELKRREHDHS